MFDTMVASNCSLPDISHTDSASCFEDPDPLAQIDEEALTREPRVQAKVCCSLLFGLGFM